MEEVGEDVGGGQIMGAAGVAEGKGTGRRGLRLAEGGENRGEGGTLFAQFGRAFG